MTDKPQQHYREALIFGKYLIGRRVDNDICQRYVDAIHVHRLECNGRDLKIENFILRFPFWIGCIDASLAIKDKQSVFRKKILVMFAILETVPEYCDYFLPKKYSFIQLLFVMATGIRSVYRLIIGLILLQFFSKK